MSQEYHVRNFAASSPPPSAPHVFSPEQILRAVHVACRQFRIGEMFIVIGLPLGLAILLCQTMG